MAWLRCGLRLDGGSNDGLRRRFVKRRRQLGTAERPGRDGHHGPTRVEGGGVPLRVLSIQI
uniref:Uncharacterized protein n=1 Tax=Arundo donax TaxID=35708 RepID=A0A0A9ANK7_ARUDO